MWETEGIDFKFFITTIFLFLLLQKFSATEKKFNEDFLGFEIELNLSLLRFECHLTELFEMLHGKCFWMLSVVCAYRSLIFKIFAEFEVVLWVLRKFKNFFLISLLSIENWLSKLVFIIRTGLILIEKQLKLLEENYMLETLCKIIQNIFD